MSTFLCFSFYHMLVRLKLGCGSLWKRFYLWLLNSTSNQVVSLYLSKVWVVTSTNFFVGKQRQCSTATLVSPPFFCCFIMRQPTIIKNESSELFPFSEYSYNYYFYDKSQNHSRIDSGPYINEAFAWANTVTKTCFVMKSLFLSKKRKKEREIISL